VLARLAPQVEEVVISANRNLERYATLGWPDCCACSKRRATTRRCVYRVMRWIPQDLARVLWDALWMEEANIAVLHDGERGHPTCYLVQWDLADDLRRFLQNRGRAMWEWQNRHRVAFAEPERPYVNVNDPLSLINLNHQNSS